VNWVADENIEAEIVRALRDDGHRVFSIAESSPGLADHEVLELCAERDATLLTADKEFAARCRSIPGPPSGLVLLRLSGIDAARKSALLRQLVREEASRLRVLYTVVTPRAIRMRRWPEA